MPSPLLVSKSEAIRTSFATDMTLGWTSTKDVVARVVSIVVVMNPIGKAITVSGF